MKSKPAAINTIWLFLVVVSVAVAAYTGKMDETTKASFESAKSAVTLAIGLIGVMALWLGIIKVAEEAGLMKVIARGLRPVMVRLFPDVPADHPAMSAMIMNFAANILGLGNAATPIGIKAMQELDKLNTEKGTATNAMCLFLAINTSAITLLPLGVITVRSSAGAANPASIFLPTLLTTCFSTCVAIVAAKLLQRRGIRHTVPAEVPVQPGTDFAASITTATTKVLGHTGANASADTPATPEPEKNNRAAPGGIGKLIIALLIVAFLVAVPYRMFTGSLKVVFGIDTLYSVTEWLMPLLMCTLLVYGYFRGVKVYETVTEGAKEGFTTAVRIIPFFVTIFVAIGMFRASGAFDFFVAILNPALSLVGMPPEGITMAFMRPLSGSGAFGIMSEIVTRAPDSFASYLVSTMQGATDTTLYILAVYFGAIGIQRSRHALPAGLIADAAGAIMAFVLCRATF
jgi:spore maturation protein SpmA